MLNTRTICLFSLLTLLVLPISAEESLKCKVGELSAHQLRSKDLFFNFPFTGYRIFDHLKGKLAGRANITLSMENKGSGFQVYSPQDLNLVGKDGTQVFPIFERNHSDDTRPMAIRLAPGAHVNVTYALSDRLYFPAKVYLGEILIAEVTE
jgi:hypothetical protein